MTNRVLDWLPLSAVAREPVRAKVTAAVSAWSEAWFSPPRRLHATRLTPHKGETAAQGRTWRIPRQALAISCPRPAAARLLDWALDTDVQRLSPTDADRKLIEAFEAQIIEDLAAKIERALGIEGKSKSDPASPYGPLGGLSIEIADEQGETLVWLALAMSDVLPACKASLPQRARSVEKLTGLRSALADTPVSIEAVLGSASLGLADLRTLAPGDVLVLDAGLEDAALLALAGSQRSVGRATLTHTEDALALTLQA
ncbi:MAG: FliM/FliN family flagellar motor switch protein [Parcubacteria group bacterium]